MAFKLKFQGKLKELYGSDNTMVRKGLVTPSYLMEGPGDEIKESSTSKTTKTGSKLSDSQLAAKQKELQELANKTGKPQSFENVYGKGGKAEDVWKTLSDEEKARFGTVEKFRKETDAYNKKMSQKLSANPESKTSGEPKVKVEQSKTKPKVKSNVVADYTADYQDKNLKISGYRKNPEYGRGTDNTMSKQQIAAIMKEKGIPEMLPIYVETSRRVATKDRGKADRGTETEIGRTGFQDEKNIVDAQKLTQYEKAKPTFTKTTVLNRNTIANAIDPVTIIKGAMMVKNLIDKRKNK